MKRKKNNAIIVSSTSESEIDAKDENLKKRINKNSLKNSIRNKKLKTSKKKFLVSQELTFVDSDDDVIESADYNLPITGTSDITSSPLEQSNSHLSSIQQPSNNLKKALFSNFQKKVFRNEESHLKKNSTKSTLFPKVDSKLAHSNELWIDLFQPQVASELAVHSKKIQEVRNWILNSFNTMDKILLMTGPSGCGKTATIKALQNELAFEIVEWENPIEENKFINKESRDQEFSVTLTKKFEEFIASSLKFSALSFVNTENIENAADIKKLQKVSNKVILIEDIPNIHNKLNANKPTLILIVSNSRENDEEESYKSKRNSNGSFRNIIPHEFILSKKVSTINFNLIAPTILIKPLKKITERFTYSSGKRSPSVADIEAVAFSSGGDVRCAINSLQFLFSDKDFDSEDVKVKKKKKKNLAKDLMEIDSINSVGEKENSLILFHAIAKILQNKREDAELTTTKKYSYRLERQTFPSLKNSTKVIPLYLQKFTRDKVLKFEPEAIFNSCNTTLKTFEMFLHQNYLENFFVGIEEVFNASEIFSCNDSLNGNWEHQSIMDNYSTSILTRGLLFAHENPTPSTGKLKQIKKPEIWKNQKLKREKTSELEAFLEEFHFNYYKENNTCFSLSQTQNLKNSVLDIIPYLGCMQNYNKNFFGSQIISEQKFIPTSTLTSYQSHWIKEMNNYSKTDTFNNYKNYNDFINERDFDAKIEGDFEVDIEDDFRMKRLDKVDNSEYNSVLLDDDIVD